MDAADHGDVPWRRLMFTGGFLGATIGYGLGLIAGAVPCALLAFVPSGGGTAFVGSYFDAYGECQKAAGFIGLSACGLVGCATFGGVEWILDAITEANREPRPAARELNERTIIVLQGGWDAAGMDD